MAEYSEFAMALFRVFIGALITSGLAALAAAAAPPTPAAKAPTPAAALLTAAKAAMMTEPQKAHDIAQAAMKVAEGEPMGADRDRDEIAADWLTGEALIRLTRPSEALPILETAVTKAAAAAPGTKLQGDVLKSRGRAEAALGRVQQALHDFQNAFAIYKTAQEPRSQSMALQEIGSIYSNARDYDRVLQYYAESQDVYGQDPTLNLSAENNRGFALKDLGRYAEAATAFRRALAAADTLQSGYLRANILENLAFTEALEGKRAAAQADIQRGLGVVARDPEAASEQPFLLGVLAKVDADNGDVTGARALLDRMFQGRDLTKTPMTFRDFHQVAADVYAKSGDPEKAFEHLKAFKRLDDQGRELASSTNAALMSARFDFANQATKIAQLKAGELKRDVLLAQTRARTAVIVVTALLIGAVMAVGFALHAFLTMRRSRNRIREVNTQLEASNQSLEKALKAKTEFLATTSHEIKTPLNGILGMTQVMLADSRIDPNTRERLAIVKSAGESMSALVNDLLDVAKFETGNMSITRAEIDLPILLNDVTRMWSDKARTKGLRFELKVTECPQRVVEDADRLRQILFNLLSNAVKFTDHGQVSLIVSAAPRGESERLRFAVADTGIGIPEADFERVFESFTQLDGGRDRRHAGTGLGLAICRNLANAMEGDLTVESRVGEGSTFILELPLRRCDAPAEAACEARTRTLADSTLLVIEDNPLGQSMLRAALQSKVRQLSFAPTFEAISATDLALCDRVLADGACLGRRYPDDPVAALALFVQSSKAAITALWPAPTPEQLARLKACGVDQVLAKPINIDALILGLETALAAEQGAADRMAAA